MVQVKYFNYVDQNMENEINNWLKRHQDVLLIDIKFQATTENDYALIIYQTESK
ncbi:sporulation protein Cse60 [Lactiplantibacillus paraxiangfangensis]|uniref:sporulation protein Cse60 n=1 Tax=Lactiplantibacillus paraxiangfangensis TaxID=3076224 RepID=UPI0030C7182A